MRAFTAGTTEFLRVDNARGVVTATMDAETAQLIALAANDALKERMTSPMRETYLCIRDGFNHGAEGDEVEHYAPITRAAASSMGLMADCVREVRGWCLHSRGAVRWPRLAWSGGENAPEEFAGFWSDDQAVVEALMGT